MFSYSITCRITMLCLMVALFAGSTLRAADPKLVRASHVQAAKGDGTESAKAKTEDLSYTPQWPEPPNTGAILTRLGIGTAVVLCLCVFTIWLGKPWLQRLQVKGAGNPQFFIEATLTAGNRATLYLVRVGDTQLVAGTDASGLKSLIAIPASFKEELDQQIPEADIDPAPRTTTERLPEKVLVTKPTFDATFSRAFAGSSLPRPGVKE